MNINTEDLTPIKFLTMVKEVCEEFPAYRNPVHSLDSRHTGCAYKRVTDQDERHCLIGHVLIHKMGLTYSEAWEGKMASTVLEYEGFPTDTFVYYVANIIQRWADEVVGIFCIPWGMAWEQWEREYPNWAIGDLTPVRDYDDIG